jgi:hypothetical protein
MLRVFEYLTTQRSNHWSEMAPDFTEIPYIREKKSVTALPGGVAAACGVCRAVGSTFSGSFPVVSLRSTTG